MQVELLSYTHNPKELIYSAARQCYSRSSAYEIFVKQGDITSDKIKEFIRHLMKKGHMSPLEHVSFTFSIDGISRACSHQLVRHRIASYSQQSQRYVDMEDFKFVIPATIENSPQAKARYLEVMEYLRKAYEELKTILEKNTQLDKESINQDVRFILPNAAETKVVVTMDVRELLHFFSERLCLRSQWEIRALAVKMFSFCNKILPEIFSEAQAKCKIHNYCPENNQNCPNYPKH